ncbi:MAG: hypothetical protein H6701_05565 [Myxococcales bacterium]|nr:hypothetical protein [Myxococcales bacterium]
MQANTTPKYLAVLLALGAMTGCDDGESKGDPPVMLDGAIDDMAARDMAPPVEDMAPPVEDMAPAEDMAPPVPDMETPRVIIDDPEALLYVNDPVTDDGMLSRVVLEGITGENGRLTSPWVEVQNCLNEPGGVSAMNPGGLPVTISLCHEVQVARPGPEGHYTHIEPPANATDPNDSFAEVMMFHHVNRVHDYFKDTHAFADLDFPLPALVNVQFQIDPPLPFPGLVVDREGWVQFDNAAFFPRESWELFASQFGLPPRDTDTIIFFQGAVDFSYDARVIYHEYTHAVIGTGRLQVPAVPDEYGLDNSSPSMNEGLADYFAASLADDAVIGAYVGSALGLGGALRDLSEPRRCPDDTVDEIHAHGLLVGSTMWAVREAIGAEAADQIVFGALMQFTPQTTHKEASALILAEAAAISPEVAAQVEAIFTDRGFGTCERSRVYERFSAAESRDRVPHMVEGLATIGFTGFEEVGVPGYKQFYVIPEAGTQAVRLSWTVGSNGLGGLFGGGGGDPALELALRRGAPVRLDYEDGVSVTHDARFAPAVEGEAQTVILAGDCLPAAGEKLHVLFFNRGDDQVTVPTMDVELLDAVPVDAAVEGCQAAE